MEISYLNYRQQTLDNNDYTGKIYYDPSDKSLIFYDENEELSFIRHLGDIRIIPHFLREHKIAFKNSETNSLITIECDKKESLDIKTFRYVLNKIIAQNFKFEKDSNKVDTKYFFNLFRYIITKPKDYQLEILEDAKMRNTIVFLETGMGKTYISVLLIKHIYEEPLDCNINNKIVYKKVNNKKVLFLFKTISLLIQQSKVLKYNTNLRVIKLYGGNDGISSPPFSKFKSTIEKYDIICATPETIYRYFTFGYLSINDLSLIVLDECHHTKDRDYYNLILKHFVQSIESDIRILGLTASPSFDNEKTEEKIAENIQNLCNNMNCYLSCPSTIIKESPYYDQSDGVQSTSEKEIDFLFIDKFSKNLLNQIKEIKNFIFKEIVFPILLSYIKKKEASYFYFHNENFQQIFFSSLYLTLACEEDRICDKQTGIFEKEDYEILSDPLIAECFSKDFLDKFKLEIERSENEKINFSRELREFLKKTQDEFVISSIRKFIKNTNLIIKYVDLDSVVLTASYLLQNIKDYYIQVFAKYDESITNAYAKLENMKSINYKSTYLESLEAFFPNAIKEIELKGENKKSIVFINHRSITKLLNDKINLYLNKTGYLSRFVLGCQSSSNSVPFSEEDLKKNIDVFTTDPKCLVLFATNVVEEGIDVPQCNNVINLSEIRTIKEYIQKTGRARKADSKIFVCCDRTEENIYREKVKQIKLSIKVMKKIINENKLEPKPRKEKYIASLNYYETNKGARVYLQYAKKMVEEFIGKLFFDGYTYNRSAMKIEEMFILGKTYYRPYLSLPYILEANFSKIFDHSTTKFDCIEDAKNYFKKYEDFYYLKAVKMLHLNNYFNDYLMFSKNFDELLSVENSCIRVQCEPIIKVKNALSKPTIKDSCEIMIKEEEPKMLEVVAHILKISPNYIDINYGINNEQKTIAIISDSPLTLINFDIFIHSTVLLKLYYFNTEFDETETYLPHFSKKPKIPFNMFTKINISMDEYQSIKYSSKDAHLINFFYSYLLFTSTDAELLFYYSIYTKKFDFAEELFLKDSKTSFYLKYIFENFSEKSSGTKSHLLDFQNCNFDFSNHVIKFALLSQDSNGKLYFDIGYIISLLINLKREIKAYYFFLADCLESDESIKKIFLDQEYKKEKEERLYEKRKNINLDEDFRIMRNLVNFGKLFRMNYGVTDIRGTTIYKDKTDYQRYFLEKYGVLTDPLRDYKKCLPLDYNMKVLKYKVNIGHLGNVSKAFHKTHHLKKFLFLPNEVLLELKSFTIDQLHLFTMLPIILFKVQHSMIYYYQASCLRQRFPSFKSLEQIDIRLLTQSLNSRSTLECENYERLEFLGDSVLKFLSTCEVFKLYPGGNRDLLYSKRRNIENNKSLYKQAIDEENKLDKFLFTSPMTVKRVKIPGFNKDESLIFNIGYNRSFAKSCFLHRQSEKVIDQSEMISSGVNLKDFLSGFIEDFSINPGKLLDEEITEKLVLNIKYENNEEPVYASTEVLIDESLINEVVTNKIEVSYPKSFRILYNKVLADLVESLTGYLLHSSVFIEGTIHDMFNKSSSFLNELKVLKVNFCNFFDESFWEKNLKNENCKFRPEQKYLRVRPIAENGRYKFENLDLLYQACTHSSYLSEESMKGNFPYVNRSYQRLAFLGEAFVSFYVSLWVYQKNPDADECLLHKLKICGINHHIISLIAIDLHLDDCLLAR
jgi:ERCC4-related helicase/dsRNA-specific ribonuclease